MPTRATTTTTHQHFRSTSTAARGGRGRQRLCASNNDKDDDGTLDPFLSGSDFGSIDNIDNDDLKSLTGLIQNKVSVGAPILSLAALQQLPLEANAADGSNGGGQLVSALAAYGHYISLFVIVGCLVTERLTVRPNMSDEEENRLAIADTTYGVAGLLLAYTGYLRATADWGKGFDYYAHEPIFWVKIIFVAIFGAVSFFPTTKIIQRGIDKRSGNLVPMSEELANRMTSLINAELLMVGSIPLTATLMSRGVLYMPDFPWPLGAFASVAALGGLGFKYIKEALDWKEPVDSLSSAPDEK